MVDEEHDPSYKQQEGARYSARDLAVWRGQREGAKVMLGSATPSLESWHQSRPAEGDDAGGRYVRLAMPSRIGAGALPAVRLVDMNLQPPKTVLSGALLDAIGQRIARGEQSMVFLNRRGYAPVLACGDCGWKSECPHCSAYRVFHKIDRTLRCHHCGFTERVPRACPACGNPDIAPVGRGTERLEEHLGELFAASSGPTAARCASRASTPTARASKGALESQLAAVHAGEVDVLVGTQMIAKGHDFRRITLVAAVNPDGALFSQRLPRARAAVQPADAVGRPRRARRGLPVSAGRDGRDVDPDPPSAAPAVRRAAPARLPGLRRSASSKSARAAGMPPFAFQALLRADARTQEAAQAFLNAASAAADALEGADRVTRYPAVPLAIQRVANVERAQMLIESASRAALQRLLAGWQPLLHALRREPEGKGVIRWLVDVDPHSI